MLLAYDYEVFKYDWLVVFIDIVTGEKTVIINDKEKLEAFHNIHKDDIYIGFNSRNYDQYIHKGILCGFNPYDISHFIIQEDKKGWQFSDLFRNIQMYNYDVYQGMTDNGLKTLEAFLGNDIKETDVPFDLNRKLTIDEIQLTLKYCTHDVEQLICVLEKRKDAFNTQLAMLTEFKLPLVHISKTTAQLIAVILGAHKKECNDEWDVRLPDTIQLKKYWYVAEWFKNNRSTDPYITNIAGVEHVFADGGLHGAIKQFNYECKPDELMLMADVTSLYPSIMIQYDLLSRSVNYKNKFVEIYDTNIQMKAAHDPRRPVYKLICNTTYGCSGDKFNPLYDPLNRRLVCIFGQVLILDLIEHLEPHIIKLIQTNTDGILILIKRKDFELIDDIVYEWEQRTRLSMEFDFYKKIYQGDVNNYVVVPFGDLYNEKGKPLWKCKGAYVKKLSDLDNDLPIVNKALIDYMVKGIPVETTINECNELIQFQKVFKLTSNYKCAWHNGEKMFNKSYRVFASKDKNDTYIGKSKGSTIINPRKTKKRLNNICGFDNGGGWCLNKDSIYYHKECPFVRNLEKLRTCEGYEEVYFNHTVYKGNRSTIERFANTPEHCFINNDDINGATVPPQLDRQWYIDLANKRLAEKFGL